MSGVRLFIGGHASRVQGEILDLAGDRMFTAAHPPQVCPLDTTQLIGLLDSGAFTDPPHKRLTPDAALDRQLKWEQRASKKFSGPFQASGLVSYDLLIDEVWTNAEKSKRRWSVKDAEQAVTVTIEAAAYLSSQREQVAPRRLILSCQGVDSVQYSECIDEVLKVTRSDDWIGLGGWCILGRQTRWMPTFWATLHRVLPKIAAANVRNVHIFGVLYLPALGGLLWLADRHGLTVSTDSTAPILSCTWKDKKKSGARAYYWRDNVAWWIGTLATLRDSVHYRRPPLNETARQEALW